MRMSEMELRMDGLKEFLDTQPGTPRVVETSPLVLDDSPKGQAQKTHFKVKRARDDGASEHVAGDGVPLPDSVRNRANSGNSRPRKQMTKKELKSEKERERRAAVRSLFERLSFAVGMNTGKKNKNLFLDQGAILEKCIEIMKLPDPDFSSVGMNVPLTQPMGLTVVPPPAAVGVAASASASAPGSASAPAPLLQPSFPGIAARGYQSPLSYPAPSAATTPVSANAGNDATAKTKTRKNKPTTLNMDDVNSPAAGAMEQSLYSPAYDPYVLASPMNFTPRNGGTEFNGATLLFDILNDSPGANPPISHYPYFSKDKDGRMGSLLNLPMTPDTTPMPSIWNTNATSLKKDDNYDVNDDVFEEKDDPLEPSFLSNDVNF